MDWRGSSRKEKARGQLGGILVDEPGLGYRRHRDECQMLKRRDLRGESTLKCSSGRGGELVNGARLALKWG